MVSHNGGTYLPSVLAAIAAQSRPANTVLAADTGSQDGSLKLLQDALGDSRVVSHTGHDGFGGAVKATLKQLAPAGNEAQEWLWLLHDDAEPAPEALAELLHAVERAPAVTIAGCKQLDYAERRRLVDVGLSTSRWAERVTLIESDEQDQGQYDGRSDTLAVNSAGMLIRRDIWDLLGGMDPALPFTGDDVDLGWRNWLAGNRVVVVPTAKMYHVEDREGSVATPLAARRAEVYLRLKHSPWWQLPFLFIGALLGGIFQLLAGVAMKDPGYGFMQLAGTLSSLVRWTALSSSRRVAARTRKAPRSVVRGLQASRREIRSHRRSMLESLTGDPIVGDGTGVERSILEPTGDANDDFVALATPRRLWSGTGAIVAVVALTAASLIAFLRFFGAGAAAGGALLPVSSSLGTIWQHATSWWIDLGGGLPGHGDPFDYVLWILGVLGFGNASASVVWVLLLALPLAGLLAWYTSGFLTTLRWPRFIAAFVWAGAPALQVALGQGRLGALIAHVMLPLAVLGMVRAVGGSVVRRTTIGKQGAGTPRPGTGGVPSWTAAAAGGLALAVVTASAPLLLPLAVVAVVFISLALRRRARSLWWSLLPSLALFIPLLISTLDNPRAVFGDPETPTQYIAAPLWQQLLGQPISIANNAGITGLTHFASGGFPWAMTLVMIVAAPLVVLAIIGAILPGRGGVFARIAWVVAALGLVTAYFAGTFATAAVGSALVTPFVGPVVSAVFLMLLLAAVRSLDALHSMAQTRSDAMAAGLHSNTSRAIRGVAGVLAALLIIAPLVSLTVFTARSMIAGNSTPQNQLAASVSGQSTTVSAAVTAGQYGAPFQVQPNPPATLPATASDRGTGPEHTRTLVLTVQPDGTISAALMRADGTTEDSLSAVASAYTVVGDPGAETIASPDGVVTDIRTAVAAIVSHAGVDPRATLARLGVGFVVLKNGDTAAELLASQINSVPGLGTVGPTEAGALWRVDPQTTTAGQAPEVGSRVRLLDRSGNVISYLPSVDSGVDTTIPVGDDGRIVVLSERSNVGWTAWLDGHQLTRVDAQWAQGFTVPASGGHLEIRFQQPWDWFWNIVTAVVLAITVLMSIPIPPRRTPRRPVRGSSKPGAHAGGSGHTRGSKGYSGSTRSGSSTGSSAVEPSKSSTQEVGAHV
ncbi:MAG: glycosyltransferase family 2 protein [Acidobacteria bacterium]|nr:glycosyltransferase family 2 protein [Acidobacteriota bacterium]